MAGATGPSTGDESVAALSIDNSRLAALAASLADQVALLYGVRPADPTARLNDDTLAFAFKGGLSGSDELLLGAGRDQQVREFREHFLEAASQRLADIVCSFTGASVSFFFSAFDPGSHATTCSFVLEAKEDRQVEQRRAVRNWSEQVRRNAHDLRLRHSAIREEHRRLRESLEQAHGADARGQS